jgi:hypothetical protein
MPNMYTSRKKNWNLRKNNYVRDLWKYGSILTIQKSLIKIGFLREDIHIKVYYLIPPYMESIYIIWNEIQYEPFYFLPF